MFSEEYQCHFSDISDDVLVSTSQLIEGYVSGDLWNDCSVTNDKLIAASQAYDISVGDYTGSGPTDVQNGSAATSSTTRFSEPLTDEQLTVIQQRRFP